MLKIKGERGGGRVSIGNLVETQGLTCSGVPDDEVVVFDGDRGHTNDGDRISSRLLWLLGRRGA